MKILAIDPGTDISGWVCYSNGKVIFSGVNTNEWVLNTLRRTPQPCGIAFEFDYVALEMIQSFGMPVGREVFQTCVWIGRYIEAWGGEYKLVYRKDVKMTLCGTTKAKDANIRQALIDRIGPQGVKAAPGPTYGVKSHGWAALGVAVTAADMIAKVAVHRALEIQP